MYKVGLQSPKIKKQKLVQNQTLVPNLSQLYIQIPKPQFSNKISFVNQTQLSQQPSYQHHYYTDDQSNKISQNLISSNKADSNDFIFSITKTKNSNSSASKAYRSQSEIIKEWIRNMFHKKDLLGLHWQQKLRRKKKLLLKEVFQLIKEQNKSQSIYLQTQSKHKSLFKKDQHLISIALQSFKNLNHKFSIKMKHQAFSMILRHLIFKPYHTKSDLKQSRIIYQSINPLICSKIHYPHPSKSINQIHSNNINIKILSIANKQKNENKIRSTNQHNVNQEVIKQQIKKSMCLLENQYALNPLSPSKFKSEKNNIKPHHCQMKKSHLQHNMIYTENKQTTNIPIRHSPNIHNKFVEFDPINGPQTPKKLAQTYINAPLTPKKMVFHHQQANNAPPYNQINHYQSINQYLDNNKVDDYRSNKLNHKELNHSTKIQQQYYKDSYKRPTSHSPFTHIIHQPIISDTFEADNHINGNHNLLRKSRSISFSGKMKLQSPNNHQNAINVPQNCVINLHHDYQDSTNKLRMSNQRVLGLQNRKIRENYQKNSYNNELIQDNKIVNYPHDQYIKSNPITPRYHDNIVNTHSQQQYYYVKSQDHIQQNSPRSSHNTFGRHSFIPIQKQTENMQKNNPSLRKSMQLNSNGQNISKKLSKDKLAITQKIRYN